MPSLVVTAHTTARTIAAERGNAVVKAKSLTIDNQVGAGDCAITIQDSFTPAPYIGVPAPGAELIERFRALVQAGDMITWGEEDLKGVRCLGAMLVDSDVIKATCYITVGYEHE